MHFNWFCTINHFRTRCHFQFSACGYLTSECTRQLQIGLLWLTSHIDQPQWNNSALLAARGLTSKWSQHVHQSRCRCGNDSGVMHFCTLLRLQPAFLYLCHRREALLSLAPQRWHQYAGTEDEWMRRRQGGFQEQFHFNTVKKTLRWHQLLAQTFLTYFSVSFL